MGNFIVEFNCEYPQLLHTEKAHNFDILSDIKLPFASKMYYFMLLVA